MPGTPDRATSSSDESATSARREDRVMSVPLVRLFYPDPDPTEEYPKESADVEGYIMTPDRSITLAASAATPRAVEMLDAVWALLRRKGVGKRHMLLLDDRGRTVSVMNLHLETSEDTLHFLRSALVVPIHARGGFAEVHLLASSDDAASVVERIIELDGPLPTPPSAVALPTARETGALQPEDWAFLGLLSCVGAFDGPEGPTPELLAELLGVDPDAFAEKARAVERSMQDVVTGLFASPGPAGLAR